MSWRCSRGTTAPCKGWENGLELDPRKVVTNPRLEESSDGKFDYASNRSGSLHRKVNATCKTETNLDDFGRMIDSNIWRFRKKEGFTSLQRLFDEER
jgi:hypothetical protein